MPGPAQLPSELAEVVTAALARFGVEWDQAAKAIDTWPVPSEALLAATTLTEGLTALELPAKGLALRGRQARRWRRQDDLSLAGLGDELEALGLGEEGKPKKSLAAKLDRAGAAAPEGEPA